MELEVSKFLINIAPQFADEVIVLFPYFLIVSKFHVPDR